VSREPTEKRLPWPKISRPNTRRRLSGLEDRRSPRRTKPDNSPDPSRRFSAPAVCVTVRFVEEGPRGGQERARVGSAGRLVKERDQEIRHPNRGNSSTGGRQEGDRRRAGNGRSFGPVE